MFVTKAVYDASICCGKKIGYSTMYGGEKPVRSINYYVCSECDPKNQSTKPCFYKQRDRCTADPDGPTADKIFNEFLSAAPSPQDVEDRTETIKTFCHHFGREWFCSGCEYWELGTGNGGFGKSAYSTTHGAKTILGSIIGFCGYFIIRKCMMGQEERKKCIQCMIDLVNFMLEREYITDVDDAKRVVDAIRPGIMFEPDTIQDKLNALWANDYWAKLKGAKKARGNEDNDGGYEVGKTLKSELPWEVREITDDGWCLESFGSYGTPAVELKLPNDVRELGLEGMQLSCMELTYLGHGIWEPKGAYGMDENVCANIYPP